MTGTAAAAIRAVSRAATSSPSLKHPACGSALESSPQAGLVSPDDPEAIR